MGRFDILLVGHRGTGKSTVAREMAQRGWHVVDLDAAIEAQTGRTAAELVATDEPAFRAIEAQTLAQLCQDACDLPRIVVPGAGCLALPDAALVVWLHRRGWERSALAERKRLRPEWSFEAEVKWMRDAREPVWTTRADLFVEIPAGRSSARVAAQLGDLLRWAQAGGEIPSKTWLIAQGSTQRLDFLVRSLGLRGVEVRSDLHPGAPQDIKSPVLASLRGTDVDWLLRNSAASAFDVDARFLDLALPRLVGLPKRTLIVSAHPEEGHPIDLEAATQRAREALPAWKIEAKIAGPFGPQTLTRLNAHTRLPTLPQMRGWRAMLAFENTQNYLMPGIRADRLGGESGVPPMDLLDWLPYFGLPRGARRACVVGADVSDSQGAWWHRREEEKLGRALAYFRVDTAPKTLSETAALLRTFGVEALSVTSPLKPEAASLCHSNLPALNTLRFAAGWEGADTDELGMRAMLAHVRDGDSLLVVGTGAVAHAVLRALDGGKRVLHLPGRYSGEWPQCDVVINATGHTLSGVPTPRIWMDLGYNNTDPVGAAMHLNGDEFFDAQAHGQRRFWGWST